MRIEHVYEDHAPSLELILKQHGFTINQLLERWRANTPAQIGADQNDYDLGDAFVARLSSDASRTITGIANGEDGVWLLIINVGAQDIVLANQNAGSVAANRIITTTGSDVTLGANARAFLWYDGTTARWRQIL